MTGYIRKDTTNNIADGNIINASDFDNEFDGIQAAFNSATGHTHDGTAAEGAAITKIGPVQDVVASTTALYPKTTATVDLGTSSLKYKDLYLSGGVNTTTLTASSTVTLSGGTANGVAYLNGSKVVTSGSALVFDGTNLGVGTSSPQQKLSVSGGIQRNYVAGETSDVTGFIYKDVSGNSAAGMYFGNTFASNYGAYLTFKTTGTADSGGPTERMRLDSAGNLGLGVTPSAWGTAGRSIELKNVGNAIAGFGVGDLELLSNAYYATGYKYANSGTAAANYQLNAGTHAWFVSTDATKTAGNPITFTQAMTLDASGNLAIGTTSAQATLNVASANVATDSRGNAFIRTTDAYAADKGAQLMLGGGYTTNGYYGFGGIAGRKENSTNNNVAGYLAFLTTTGIGTTTERARIDSSGSLLVGTTSLTSAERLAVTQSSTSYIAYLTNSHASSPNGVVIRYSATNPAGTSNEFLYCTDSVGLRASFRSNGGLANYSANNVNLSDERTKTDIQDAGGYLTKICAIPVRTFKYKDQTDDLLNLGVIAQEVEAVAPELVDVSGFGETPEDGVPLKAIYQTDLQYALMKCIQEQQTIIQQLQADVAALKGQA